MATVTPRVFSIPPGCPFLPTLVEALVGGALLPGFPGAEAPLADATIYLPTRRAARALAALLAARGGGRAQLLPRIVPLNEADGAEIDPIASGLDDPAALAPPIQPLERRLILTHLIQRWSAAVDRDALRLAPDVPFLVPSSPADAVALAGDLEALMDSFTTEDVPWDNLSRAVETEYSQYFEITRQFVDIAARYWPRELANRNASDPATRRNALLRAEAERLLRDRPDGPIVAAGSTGSMPATAALLAAIARLPNGAVVLPGLDTDLDEESFRAIAGGADGSDPVPGHPQAALQRLLANDLQIGRDAVTILGGESEAAKARRRLVSETLRPAESTDRWSQIAPAERLALSEAGCRGIALIEAADERDEALAIAVALRETLEEPGRTAALVTPDRALAIRVVAELDRWAVRVEDSAGCTLAETAMGRIARLAADAALHDFDPVRVLALLAEPEVRLGLSREAMARAATALEIGVLRGPAPAPGLDGLRRALRLRRGARTFRDALPVRRLTDRDDDFAADLIERLAAAFGSFAAEARGEGAMNLLDLVAPHRRAVEMLLAVPAGEAGPEDRDRSAEALASLFEDLLGSASEPIAGRFADYPAFFATLARQARISPSPRATHRRLKVLGLLEARLLGVDRVVLGGLDEGLWPPRTETDAFLNRPMRAGIGLSPPERRIGQTAHDFAQALGCADVVISRAAKRGGKPMVPSRFLQRLKAFVGERVFAGSVEGGERFRRLARLLDTPKPAPPLPRPKPRPDPALFPRSLSVTEIETLVRDPYAIYARHILKLEALEPLAAEPGAAERGTLIHDVLGRFAGEHPVALPALAAERLLQLGEDAFGDLADSYPELHAEWWRRFERLAQAYIVWEAERRAGLKTIFAERSGALVLPLADGTRFTLRGRADRIEDRGGGDFAIVDFKTGQPPSAKEVCVGFSPQLTLEAAMLMEGVFKDVAAASQMPEILYVQVSGGRTPLREKRIVPKDGRTIDEVIADHWRAFAGMIAAYAAGERAYVSRPYPKYARRFSAYDHLARVKEWSLANADEEGEP